MPILALVRRSPLTCFFGVAYTCSALALLVIGVPRLHGAPAYPASSLVMFPVMVVGVGLTGVALTAAATGRRGLVELRSSLTRHVRPRWLLVAFVPPLAIAGVLEVLRTLVSPNFAPGFLPFGVAAGVLAGFFEEFGWSGFAYPRLGSRLGALPAALLLGLVWGLWHLPVVDSLGAASPHGTALPAFFAAFVLVLVGLRVLIAWSYTRTGSLLMAQVVHASSTGFLVVLSAPRVTPAQEASWYFAYAGVLWVAVMVVVIWQGFPLGDRAQPAVFDLPGSARRASATW